MVIISCKSEQSDLKLDSLKVENVMAIGEKVDTTFSFCGIVPELKEYSYRTGVWQFKTDDGIKFAEGEYNVEFKKDVWKRGGCPYSYYENFVDLSKWTFWNLNGDKIEPSENLFNLINYKAHTEY